MMDTYLVALENELQSILIAPEPAYEMYYGMFRYHLGWVDANLMPIQTDTGKRLRPLLCLLACEATGDDWHRALPVAAAIELVHNFSLIHDDIEDQSDERRGRPAVWKVWGLAHGLNAGDGMYMLARLALDRLWQQGIAPEKCARINHVFDATTLAICQGQFLDLCFESRLDVTIEEYLQMIRGKTAALIAAALRLGAMLGTDDVQVIEAFARFGENIGLAFQMVDDILGVWGDPAVTGKSAATDILSKKKALPAIIGLNHPQYGATLRAIYSQPQLTPDDVAHVLGLLDAMGARAHTQQRAEEYCAQALRALEASGIQHRAIRQLREMAKAMTQRVK
jgi:geranylgeranyl diphosphate synthase type I